MHPRLAYEYSQWKPRALKRAESLDGKEWTEREKDVLEAYKLAYPEDDCRWATFMAFGIRPEMQIYINHTIEMLKRDKEDYKGMFLMASVRLQWSCKDIYNKITN